MLAHILDLLIAVAIWWCADRWIKLLTGRGILERIAPRFFEQKEETGPPTPRERQMPLFESLCLANAVKPMELFKIARTESGFGWSDKDVERHYAEFVVTMPDRFPNYVENFLDKVEEALKNE